MIEKKRTFIAVHFSDEVIANLAKILSQVRRLTGEQIKIKWVEPHNVHLTLQFLGDTDTDMLARIASGLKGAFVDVQSFEVSLAEIGAFPSPARPRVIWVGIKSGVDRLKTLQDCVERVTSPLGFMPENREFKAHVTLGRVKEYRRSADLVTTLAQFNASQAGKCHINAVHMMSSDLKPTGPVYSILDSFPIGR
jgi:2'-5' RNA ligase